MLVRLVKRTVRKTVRQLGFEIRRITPPEPVEPPPPPPEPVVVAALETVEPPPPPPVEEPTPEPVAEAPAQDEHRFYSGEYDPEVHGLDSMEGFLRFLRQRNITPRCILDVGANETRWARLAAKVFPESRLVLIEPQEEMVPAMAEFCASHPSARFVQAGAAAHAGEAVLTVWDDLQGTTFVVPTIAQMLAEGKQRVTPLVTLDGVFETEEHLPELVKLDIQGYELEALKGAGRLLGRTEVFILEVQLIRNSLVPGPHEVVEFMHRHGYQLYDLCGYFRRPLDDALGQLDMVFARSDGPLCRDRRWSASDPLGEAPAAEAA